MNSKQALAILQQHFPRTRIDEVEGNPNIVGEYLFRIDGHIVWVTEDGEVNDLEEEKA